jgi:hypothetical protein
LIWPWPKIQLLRRLISENTTRVGEAKDDGLDNHRHCIAVFGSAGVILEANVLQCGEDWRMWPEANMVNNISKLFFVIHNIVEYSFQREPMNPFICILLLLENYPSCCGSNTAGSAKAGISQKLKSSSPRLGI